MQLSRSKHEGSPMVGRQKDYLEGAILAVDAVGYSRLMGKDEEATLRRLHTYRGLIQNLATKHGGRVFGVAGDSEMAIFAEAGDAVGCALDIQDAIGERNTLLPKDSRMPVRIGINYGQVIVEDDSFFGDDVNIAARLESFAEAGEVCLSGTIFDRVKESKAWGFDSFGEECFKNIARPVRVYRVRTDPEALGQVIPTKRRRPRPGRVWRAAAAAFLIALLGATGWGVKVQIEKRRAEVAAASVIAEAQSSVATAEAQIVELLENLRQSEKRAIDERERVEGLLVSLQKVRSQVDRNEQAALAQADEAQDLLALLRASEARAEAEEERVETLLAALREAEEQVTAAREVAEQERQARQDAEQRAADQALMESLLASWRAAEERAAEERARTEALLAALQDAEARAEAKHRVKLEQQRTEDLLARLTEAHGLAVRERSRAEDLYDQVQEARAKAADHEDIAQELAAEAVRIEALLETLRAAEGRVAAERDRVRDMLEALRRAEPAPPEESSLSAPDGNGSAWQDAGSLARAEVLLAAWTEAERAAASERQRTEVLLAALETLPQPEPAPPPVPPPKPERPSVTAEDPAPEGAPTEEAAPVQLAHNRIDETQALPPLEPIAPVLLESRPEAPTENPWDGTWVGSNDAWTVELTVADGTFQLDVSCEARAIRESVSGSIDDTGQISAILSPPRLGWYVDRIPVAGTPEALNFISRSGGLCIGGTLKLERVAGGPDLAHAARDSGAAVAESWDGTWTGKSSSWTVELTVADGKFRLDALCQGNRPIGDSVSGSIDETGQITTVLRPLGSWYNASVSGTPERLEIVPSYYSCSGRTVVELERVGSEPTVTLATEPSFNHFDGKWVGRASTVRSGPKCAVTFTIEITVGGRNFTGFASESRWHSYMRRFSGTVDAAGKIESKRVSLQKNIYHGTLLADLGEGAGQWSSEECNGTFELTRVE